MNKYLGSFAQTNDFKIQELIRVIDATLGDVNPKGLQTGQNSSKTLKLRSTLLLQSNPVLSGHKRLFSQNMIANILSNSHVLKTILECQANQKDICALLSSCKKIGRARTALIYETFVLKINRVDHYYCALKRGALRINLTARPRYFKRHEFDFQNGMERKLLYFECFCFNRPVQSFGNLKFFKCHSFNQPVESFDSLIHFQSDYFDKPVSSFGRLRKFICRTYSSTPPDPESFINIDCMLCFKKNKIIYYHYTPILVELNEDWSMPN